MNNDVGLQNDRAAWIKGPSGNCSIPPTGTSRAWRLVLLGAPGVGKGTQAEMLCKNLGACHLSTGDVFRAAKSLCDCDRSPAMTDALNYMRRGDLVPDTTVLNVVRERGACLMCLGGFILDRFPRTAAQAVALDELLSSLGSPLDAVIDYHLPLDEIVSRLSGRRTCAQCKSVFHLTTNPPRIKGRCDHCQGQLIQREDDRPESIVVRMHVYHEQTSPLTEHYRSKGQLISVDAAGTPEQILGRTWMQLARIGKLAPTSDA